MTPFDLGDGINAFWRIWSGRGSIHTTHTHVYMCVDLEHGTLALAVCMYGFDWKPYEENYVRLRPWCCYL